MLKAAIDGIPVKAFLSRTEEITAEGPSYVKGQDGSKGECDCIGLIIGAIRRAGGVWRGLHGSNYAARQELEDGIMKITGTGDLKPGMVVFKALEPTKGKYDLPSRYLPGGAYYNGDLRDYYHVGIVVSVYPLRIRHMTKPKPKTDTDLGSWAFYGKLKKVDYSDAIEQKEKGIQKVETVIISGGVLTAPIKMRSSASTGDRHYIEIPQGSEAELLEGGGAWNKIKFGSRTGYVESRFVHRTGETDESGGGSEMVSVNRADLERIYDELGDMLGLRG